MTTLLTALTATGVITSATAPTMGAINRYNAASGALAVTLPALSAQNVGARTVLQKDTLDTSTNVITFGCAGSDTFDDATTSVALSNKGQQVELQVFILSGVKHWKITGSAAGTTSSGRPNSFDKNRSAYNWKASNTRKLRAALGKAAIGSRQHFLTVGDSITQGYMGDAATPVSDALHAWPRMMRANLVTQGIPIGGTGVVPTSDGTHVAADPRWTATGSWINYPYGYIHSVTSGDTLTFTSDTAGTQVDVYYFSGGGAFTVIIDGGSAVTPTSGSGLSILKYTVTGLANTTHTVLITTSNTTDRYIVGASVTAASGLIVDNVAVRGMTSGNWLAGVFIGPNDTFLGGALTTSSIVPAAMFISLGVNDYIGAVASATFKSNITTLRTQFSASDVILVAEPTSNYFLNEHYDLADSLDVPLIDTFDRYGGTLTGNPGQLNGLVTDSAQIHGNQAMHADWGRAIAELVGA